MKICGNCGQTVQENAKFCPFCASSDLRELPETPTDANAAQKDEAGANPFAGTSLGAETFAASDLPPQNAYTAPEGNASAQPTFPDGAAPSPALPGGVQKALKNKTLVLAIAAASVLLLIVIVVVAVVASGPKFTPGEVQGGVYTNEWADLQFDLGDAWTRGGEKDFSTNEHIIVGFSAKGGLMDRVAVLFTDGTAALGKSETEIVNAFIGGVMQSVSGAEYFTQVQESEISTLKIAGKEYKLKSVNLSIAFVSVSITVAIRKQNDRAILILAMGGSEAGNRAVLQSFTTVK